MRELAHGRQCISYFEGAAKAVTSGTVFVPEVLLLKAYIKRGDCRVPRELILLPRVQGSLRSIVMVREAKVVTPGAEKE